jgi:hypothetical protein
VSVAMGITVMLTAQEQHANQDSQCSIIKNVGKIAKVIKLGSVLIIIVGVEIISSFKMECALTAMQHVGHAAILVILVIVSAARTRPGVL